MVLLKRGVRLRYVLVKRTPFWAWTSLGRLFSVSDSSRPLLLAQVFSLNSLNSLLGTCNICGELNNYPNLRGNICFIAAVSPTRFLVLTKSFLQGYLSSTSQAL